jgi:hypothetical protein
VAVAVVVIVLDKLLFLVDRVAVVVVAVPLMVPQDRVFQE